MNGTSNDLSAPTPGERLQRVADDLGEHYDSVLIIVTQCEEGGIGGTLLDWAQSGNAFASKGAAQEWLVGKEEDYRIHRRKRAEED